jgi:hypothetical protein
MANASGPVESITLSGRRFPCDGEDTVNIQLSGTRNEVKSFGDGQKRVVKSRGNGKIEGLNVGIDDSNQDLEYLQGLQDRLVVFDVSLTKCDGTVYAGAMQLTGDIITDGKEGLAGITLEGDLEQQS